jgi:orotidine-5'-phosphate decarboxylase
MKSAEFISEQILSKKSMLCVGLDPDLDKIPSEYKSLQKPLLSFCKDIIECSNEFAIAYKLNVAFFEAHGPDGWKQFEEVVSLIPKDCLVIADAKRADIGNTSQQYANYYFDKLKVDGITLHPYMGVDSLEPFLKYKNRWSIILGLTSNEGSNDFELKKLDSGEHLYERVIQTFLQLDDNSNLMFVCGATHPAEFIKIRQICPDHFLLVPGVGAQGGELKSIIANGKNKQGGLLINISRKICYPDNPDHKLGVYEAALNYQREMSGYIY